MTYTRFQPVNVGIFFSCFQKYWYYRSQRGIQYNNFQVLVVTNKVYLDLKSEWEKFQWDLDELQWTIEAIYNKCSMLDPSNFINQQFAYLDHVKNCYYLRNSFENELGDVWIIWKCQLHLWRKCKTSYRFY